MGSRGSGGSLSAIGSHWEKKLRDKRESLVAAILGKDELDGSAIGLNYLDSTAIKGFHRSLQADGFYKISEKDSPLVNQIKSVSNLLHSLEKIGPVLVRPLSNYFQSESLLGSTFSLLNFVRSAGMNYSDILNMFGRDLYNLQHYMQELNKIIADIPEFDKTLLPILKEVRNVVNQELKPILEYIDQMGDQKNLGSAGVKERISHAGNLLSKALDKKSLKGEKKQEVLSTTFDNMMNVVSLAKEVVERLLLDKYGIHKNKKTAKFELKSLKKLDLSDNELNIVENALHAANVLSGFEAALKRANSLLVGSVPDMGQVVKMIEELNGIIKEFNKIKIDVDMLKKSSAKVLLEELAKVMGVTQDSMIQVVRYIETIETKLDIKERSLEDKVQNLCKAHEAVSESLGITLAKKYPYWTERLSVRQGELIEKRHQYQELIRIQKTITNIQDEMGKYNHLSLKDAKKLLEKVKKISCPRTYYYEYYLTKMIKESETPPVQEFIETNKNLLTSVLKKEVEEVLQNLIDRRKNECIKLAKNVNQAINQIAMEFKFKGDRRADIEAGVSELQVISSIEPEQLLGEKKEKLMVALPILINYADPRCDELKGMVQEGLSDNELWKQDLSLSEFEMAKMQAGDAIRDRLVAALIKGGSASLAPATSDEDEKIKKETVSSAPPKWSATLTELRVLTQDNLNNYLTYLGVRNKNEIKVDPHGQYLIDVNDPLLIKNMKSLLNVISRVESMLNTVQGAYAKYDPEGGVLPMVWTVYSGVTSTIPEMKAISKQLESDFSDLLYYFNKLQTSMPDMSSLTEAGKKAAEFSIENMPYLNELVDTNKTSIFLRKYTSQAMEIMSMLSKWKNIPGLSDFINDLNLNDVQNMMAGLKKYAVHSFDADQIVKKIQLIDLPRDIIQEKIKEQFKNVKMKENGKYKQSSIKQAEEYGRPELAHLMKFSDAMVDLHKMCRSFTALSKGDVVKAVIKMLPTLLSVMDEYKKLDKVVREEISPSFISFLQEMIKIIRPGLMSMVAESELTELRLGMERGTLLNFILPLRDQFELMTQSIVDDESHLIDYTKAIESVMNAERRVVSSQSGALFKLKVMAEDPSGQLYANASLSTLVEYKALAMLLPPSSSIHFVRNVDAVISARTGFDVLDADIVRKSRNSRELDQRLTSLHTKSSALQNKIYEIMSHEETLNRLIDQFKSNFKTQHQSFTAEQLNFIYHLPPMDSNTKSMFVYRLYTNKSSILDSLTQKLSHASLAVLELRQQLVSNDRDILTLEKRAEAYAKDLNIAEKAANELREKLASPVALAALQDKRSVTQTKPDCSELIRGMIEYQKAARAQNEMIDQRIKAVMKDQGAYLTKEANVKETIAPPRAPFLRQDAKSSLFFKTYAPKKESLDPPPKKRREGPSA